MDFFILLIIACGVVFFFWKKNKESQLKIKELNDLNSNLSTKISNLEKQTTNDFNRINGLVSQKEALEERVRQLQKYQDIIDIEKFIDDEKFKFEIYKNQEIENINSERNSTSEALDNYKNKIIDEANQLKESIQLKIKTVEVFLKEHELQEVLKSEKQAEELLGRYYELANQTKKLTETNKALENKINGYSDEYLLPVTTMLDDLIEGYGFLDASNHLKVLKNEIKAAIKNNLVAECDYVEESRKQTAVAFITNAFNSKADVYISRLRHDNVGKLIQSLKDDFLLLNEYGQAFRNARINESYLKLRLEELKWGALILDFREKEKEEQREIREQIREEERAQKEYEKAIKDAEKEELLLRKAYEKAKREFDSASDDQKNKYDQKMYELMEKLKEAEEKNQRALSMAQQTRAGHVYVISNIGSFGENVLKLGMTRRLEPLDRIRELGDASVPFSFDVHAMIYSEDAPKLEKKLHHYFNHHRVNKVNYRKEFFKVNLRDVKNYLDAEGIHAQFTLKAEALQYRESLSIELLPEAEQRKLEDVIEEIESKNTDYILVEED